MKLIFLKDLWNSYLGDGEPHTFKSTDLKKLPKTETWRKRRIHGVKKEKHEM